MIALSRTALRHITQLRNHYEALERPEAIRNLAKCIEDAATQLSSNTGGLPAPRPYPQLKFHGLRWIKTGPYWVAFHVSTAGTIIAGVFHESADIPNRLA